jgi:general L-amino acid transport system permease protein
MTRLLHDRRVRAVALQLAVAGAAVLLVAWLAGNAATNLARRGIAVGFGFLDRAARFPISESLLAYEPTDSFGRAFLVGLVNTLTISGLVVAAATLLGLVVGLARRSRHPLALGLSGVYVETLRNTPLVVQLLFWYALVTVGLPGPRAALNPLPGTFLSVRGLVFPGIAIEGPGTALWTVLLLGTAVAFVARGRNPRWGRIALALTAAAAGLVWWTTGLSLGVELPRLQGFNFVGGTALTPEFVALILGLVLYSAAFIGEIVRGGIDAVGAGQWEAGRALGLADRQTLRLVVLPQALRVIIPPMTSQYLNIVKNTTLALVVGYPDIAFVAATTINQTGQAIEGIAILMSVFLTVSITVSLFMNWYNRRIALVQR